MYWKNMHCIAVLLSLPCAAQLYSGKSKDMAKRSGRCKRET